MPAIIPAGDVPSASIPGRRDWVREPSQGVCGESSASSRECGRWSDGGPLSGGECTGVCIVCEPDGAWIVRPCAAAAEAAVYVGAPRPLEKLPGACCVGGAPFVAPAPLNAAISVEAGGGFGGGGGGVCTAP